MHPVPYHLPRKIRVDSGSEVNAILPTFANELALGVRQINERCRRRLVYTQRSLRQRRKAIPVTYKPYPGHQIIKTPPHHHHFQVMTTSWSFICYFHTTISSHPHGTRRPSSNDLVWALRRGTLEARKEDYFKINASPGIWWW